MTGKANEKRGFIRVPFNTTVEVSAGDWKIRADREIDISMSGLRLPANCGVDKPMPMPGTPCRASVHLDAADHPVLIEADARIVRAAPGYLAVEFIELDLDGYEHLRRLIISNADDAETAEQQFAEHWGIRRRP